MLGGAINLPNYSNRLFLHIFVEKIGGDLWRVDLEGVRHATKLFSVLLLTPRACSKLTRTMSIGMRAQTFQAG